MIIPFASLRHKPPRSRNLQLKRFSTFTGDLPGLAEWLAATTAVMPAWSRPKYRIPVFNLLEQSCDVIPAHPKSIRSIRGQKTDKKNAQWVPSFLPPFKIRQLRDLMQYRAAKLTGFATGEKN